MGFKLLTASLAVALALGAPAARPGVEAGPGGGIPRVIHMTHGADRGAAYVDRIRETNPAFEVVDYDDAAAAAYVRENYAGTALPATYAAVAALGRPVMLADLFRLAVVAKEGGFYLDADVLAKRPLDPLVDEAAVFPLEWWKSDDAFAERHAGAAPRDALEHYQVGNYAFGAEPGHPFVADALDEATARARAVVAGRAGVWGAVRRVLTRSAGVSDLDVLRTTGPYMLSEVYHGGRLESGKYADVRLLRGDSEAPSVARRGANDWHKFGAYAEHTLAHSWVANRRLDDTYDVPDGGVVVPDDGGGKVCTYNGDCAGDGAVAAFCNLDSAGACQTCMYPASLAEGTMTCANYMNACCVGGQCTSCNYEAPTLQGQACADSPTWFKEERPDYDCAYVLNANEAKNWDKKKANKNCKKKSADGTKAKKACKCQACNKKKFKKKEKKEKTKTGSAAIYVPICIVAVFLVGGGVVFYKKKKTRKIQRRLSHRQQSMPTISIPKDIGN